jgi:hypothetical protein
MRDIVEVARSLLLARPPAVGAAPAPTVRSVIAGTWRCAGTAWLLSLPTPRSRGDPPDWPPGGKLVLEEHDGESKRGQVTHVGSSASAKKVRDEIDRLPQTPLTYACGDFQARRATRWAVATSRTVITFEIALEKIIIVPARITEPWWF